jgi:hypothetical protein
MKVLCKYNDPDNVQPGVPDNFNFGLELDKEYLIMGIMLTEKQLWYMIDEEGAPNFYPYQLFEVTDNSINSNWYFKLYSRDEGGYPFSKEAIWGYHELCFDENHYEQLIDREPEALRLYFKRKIELEKIQ